MKHRVQQEQPMSMLIKQHQHVQTAEIQQHGQIVIEQYTGDVVTHIRDVTQATQEVQQRIVQQQRQHQLEHIQLKIMQVIVYLVQQEQPMYMSTKQHQPHQQ